MTVVKPQQLEFLYLGKKQKCHFCNIKLCKCLNWTRQHFVRPSNSILANLLRFIWKWLARQIRTCTAKSSKQIQNITKSETKRLQSTENNLKMIKNIWNFEKYLDFKRPQPQRKFVWLLYCWVRCPLHCMMWARTNMWLSEIMTGIITCSLQICHTSLTHNTSFIAPLWQRPRDPDPGKMG